MTPEQAYWNSLSKEQKEHYRVSENFYLVEILPPELFTLNDLYQFYTTVLGEQFSDYSNFRSRLLKLGFLEDTGVKVSRGAGRPASLYRFDANAFAPYKNRPMVFI